MVHGRREEIIKLVEEKRTVKVQDLIERFGVSNETIRRDLEALESEGRLHRIYGGAAAKAMYGLEPDYASREINKFAEKIRIGEKAVEYIEDGDTLVIDLGTTTLQFAKALKGKRKVTVLTNSLAAGMELSADPDIRVILLGGNLRAGDLATSGFLAEDALARFNADKLILGIGGLTVEGGVTDYNVDESNLRRHMVETCREVIGLTDSSKIGTTAMNQICSAERLSVLITDEGIDDKTRAKLAGKGVEIVCVAEEN